MAWLGHLIVRLVAIAIAFVLAVFAASLFLAFGFVTNLSGPLIDYPNEPHFEGLLVSLAGVFISPFAAASVLAPSAILIALAELMRWRGLTANLLLGGIVGLFAGWRRLAPLGEPGLPQGALVVLLSAGFIAGFVYWLAAGRSAGKWMGGASSAG